MRHSSATLYLLLAAATLVPGAYASTYDINTLAGKVASVNGTAGLQLRFSAFIEHEAQATSAGPAAPITPAYVLSSTLDGISILQPNVTVNQDTAGAPQNETAIAVDPQRPLRVVAAANDYVTRTWSCTVGTTPCSALGDGYSGTYVSNDGGQTWCCASNDPNHLGTLIPGVEHLTGGPYDAGGDPSLAFDSQGNVYYAGLGFDRTAPPNAITVNRGTFDASGQLHWSAPTFINATTSPSIFNDKEWIAVDRNASSPFRDRVYVTWTRFVFNPQNGAYVQSPIAVAYSTDGGLTFSDPKSITGRVLYDQGSHPTVGPDGTVYVFWDGATRLATLDSIYMVKSTDGGVTWSKPIAISPIVELVPPRNTAFRVNSFPSGAVAPDGTVYATWASRSCSNGAFDFGCPATVLYSTSTDGGATWSSPTPAFASATQVAEGYPVAQPNGGTLTAPSPQPVETLFPAIDVSGNGHVYLGAYAADVVSPWQTCASRPPAPAGNIACDQLGRYIHNARLDYVVTDLATGITSTVNTHPINTRYGFGGSFFGDYTDIAADGSGNFHALYTDTNNRQMVNWFWGVQFTQPQVNQQDIATASGNY